MRVGRAVEERRRGVGDGGVAARVPGQRRVESFGEGVQGLGVRRFQFQVGRKRGQPAQALVGRQRGVGDGSGRECLIRVLIFQHGLADLAQVVLTLQPLAPHLKGGEHDHQQPENGRGAAEAAQHHSGRGQAAAGQSAVAGVDGPQALQADPQGGDASQKQKEKRRDAEHQADDGPGAEARAGRDRVRFAGARCIHCRFLMRRMCPGPIVPSWTVRGKKATSEHALRPSIFSILILLTT